MQQIYKTKGELVILENERWFKFWILLPVITTIIYAVASFVLGIVFAAVFENGTYLWIFWGGGAVFCALNYLFLKIVLSYRILHIYYLKNIYRRTIPANHLATNTPDELPKI